MTTSIDHRIAEELGVGAEQVTAAVRLLDDGATVPFVARYRKEATGALDDTQLRTLEQRLRYLRELEQRRTTILEEIRKQGKLDDELHARISAADTKARLEDLYLPYRPKRRTKAQTAREAGLEPLAETLLTDPHQDPHVLAEKYVDADNGIADAAAALTGARSILVERFSEDGDLIGQLRETAWRRGRITSTAREGAETGSSKFADYFDFTETLDTLPSHRVLALFRGEKEGVLDLSLDPEPEHDPDRGPGEYENTIAARFGIRDEGRPADAWLRETVRWAWRTRIMVHIDIDLRGRLRQHAEDEAVRVFASNLRDLLLAAPAGPLPTIGLDPGYRAGVKVAVVDGTGKLVETATIHPHEPRRRWDEAVATLERLVERHDVRLIAVGNGTASRETDDLAAQVTRSHRNLTRVSVSESGASVYSASAYASRELPDVDVSLRGAVSIARRLQDPLAELVKIDPKSIGVGQYQHDVSESKLSHSLDAVVEDCVNAVGVDVNTASAPLLSRVSGISTGLAENIVDHRDTHGPFRSRQTLREVSRLGPKAFEQCAGFLRVTQGENPLDASSVHPESYPVVHRIAESAGGSVTELIGNTELLRGLRPEDFADESFGVPTVTDILSELEKPGRDPRPEFRTARFAEDVHSLEDLRPGMVVEGVVTNVAAFGAFVDVGVHQDGLVHVSAMSKSFVKDPREVVKPGEVVRVKVRDVEVERKRISLTLRLEDEVSPSGEQSPGTRAEEASGGARSKRGGSSGGGGSKGSGRPRRGGNRGDNAEGSLAAALRQAGYGTD
ncbi:Tex family protein [Actinopolyspora mortivallis]|uniref:Tex family protein n=1 Tax=Actinopolyspora mortivallis TaxID=33906 RepID=UPI000373758B|nr:Tex family protein [Actinopolyspora mortivallis]